MKELIKNLIRLQAIAYYNNTRNHANNCYRDIEDIGRMDSFNACVRQGCQNVDFCLMISNIINELSREEYNKKCEHELIEVVGEFFTNTASARQYKCTKCGAIKYV